MYTGIIPDMGRSVYDHGASTLVRTKSGDLELAYPERYYKNQICAKGVDLYIFATTFQIPKLRNGTLEALDAWCVGGPYLSYVLVITAYEQLPSSSPLLRWLEDTYALNFTKDGDDTKVETILRKKLPNTFLMAVILRKIDNNFMQRAKLSITDYHERVGN